MTASVAPRISTAPIQLPVGPRVRRTGWVRSTSQYGTSGGPYVIAHRGGAGMAPENTMAAFGLSVAMGVRYLESDVRTTADGVAVAFHDHSLQRATNAEGNVAALPWSTVRQALVAGSAEGIPRMDEVLGSFPGVRFMIDVKDVASVDALALAIRRTHSAHRVCVAGAPDTWLQRLRCLCGPQLSTAMGWKSLSQLVASPVVSRPHTTEIAPRFAHVPYVFCGVPIMAHRNRRRRIMRRARALGVSVMAWVIDDPAAAADLLDDGVTGIITDRPDALRELWVQRGHWIPMGQN